MKIIKSMGDKGGWSKKYKCRECKAILEVEEGDLQVLNEAVGYAGETWEPILAFSCAVCHSTNQLSDRAVPSGIRDRLFNEARAKHGGR